MNILKIKYKYLAGLLFLGLISCNDFLNVTPTGRTETPTAFADMQGMRSAVAGTYYKVFQLYTSDFYAFGDLADNTIQLSLEKSSSAKLIYDYTPLTSSSGYWATIYELLVNINNILEYQPQLLAKFPGNKTELEYIKGEALLLRALSHYNLCKIYGQPYNYTPDASHLGVPVVLRAPNYDDVLARSSVKKVYEQIITDLNEAETLLKGRSAKDKNTKYYANQDAVYALKSRIYLYMEDWDNSIKYSGLAIGNVPLAESTNYLNMYRLLSNNESEIIFRLNGSQNKATTLMSLYNVVVTVNEKNQKLITDPAAIPSDAYLRLFDGDVNDIRFKNLIQTEVDTLGRIHHATLKFNPSDNSDADYMHFNPIVFRSSEMYLNRAEAYLNKDLLTEAANDIKKIIARAHNQLPDDVVVTTTDKAALRSIIEKERIKELSFEGHKFFDTTRWKKDMVRDANTTSTVKKLTYPNDLFLLPIPQRELDINPNMKGNPMVNN